MPISLPQPNPYNTTVQHVFHCAYNRCLDLERRHTAVKKLENGKLEVLVCARFLGYMILEAPTDEGRSEIASEIIRSIDDQTLQKLGELYKNHFV